MFPLLGEQSQQFKSLLASIDRNGQYDAIVIDDEGRILDGRNRWRACELLKREPKIVKFSDLKLGKNEDGIDVLPEDFAFDRNFGRRDLTPDQRAIIGAKFEEYIVGGKRGAPVGNGNNNPAKKEEKSKMTNRSSLTSGPETPKAERTTRAKVAKKAGVSERKAQQALDVARTDPALAKEVAAGKMKLNDAAKQTKAATPSATTHKITKWVDAERQAAKAIKRLDELAQVVEPKYRPYYYGSLRDALDRRAIEKAN